MLSVRQVSCGDSCMREVLLLSYGCRVGRDGGSAARSATENAHPQSGKMQTMKTALFDEEKKATENHTLAEKCKGNLLPVTFLSLQGSKEDDKSSGNVRKRETSARKHHPICAFCIPVPGLWP